MTPPARASAVAARSSASTRAVRTRSLASPAESRQAWLRQACRLSAGEASERVRTARVLADDLAASADALAGGVISYAHARVLASAAGELPAELLPTVEPILVEAARHTDPAGLRALCTQVRTMLDPTGAEEAAALAHDRRHLSISATFAGTVVLDGVLDPEAGGRGPGRRPPR